MLKIQLTLFALVMFQFACESPENTSPLPKAQVDYNLVSDEFRDMFEGAFRNAESLQLASVTELTEKQMTVTLEVENISKSTAEHLEGYFGEIPLLQQRTIYPLPPSYLYGTQSDKFENLDSMVNRSDVLSDAQKMYIKSLGRSITTAESYDDGFRLISDFSSEVIESRELSNDDKLLLIEIAAGSEVLLGLLKDGGFEKVQNEILSKLDNKVISGRVASCSVDWRGTWIDGVVGLTFGATAGFYTGATVGTVVMPIVGTVTGAVNAAVIGGAIGFSTGVIQGIIGDLISSCSRTDNQNLVQTFASCDAAWDAYLANEISQMPSDCFRIDIQL